jgi:hypothetical protein
LLVEEEAKHIAKHRKLPKRIHVAPSISMNTNGKTAHRSIINVARTTAMSIAYFLKRL